MHRQAEIMKLSQKCAVARAEAGPRAEILIPVGQNAWIECL